MQFVQHVYVKTFNEYPLID